MGPDSEHTSDSSLAERVLALVKDAWPLGPKEYASIERSFNVQFSAHTERGAVLAAVAIVDAKLAALLKSRMIDSNLKTGFFKEGGTIGGLGVRTRLAYLLGLISKTMFQLLEIIREIRNKFAHSELDVGFAHADVQKLMLKFPSAKEIHEVNWPAFKNIATARYDVSQDSYRFISICVVLSMLISFAKFESKPPSPPRF